MPSPLTTSLDSTNKRVLNITNMENAATSDWSWTDDFPADMGLHSIQFIPGATGTDKCIIKIGSASGVEFFHVECADVKDQRPLEFHGEPFDLYLDTSAGNYSTGSLLIIIATDRKMGPRH